MTRRLDTAPFGAYDTMEVEIVLAQSVRLPDPGTRAGGGARLGFRLYLDTDQDGATGPITDPGCTFAGNEFLVNGFDRRLDSGAYEVQGEPWNGTSGQMVGEASVTRDEVHHTIIRIRVPLSTLGNDDGQMRVALRVGNGDDRTTDCAPEAGQAFTTGR
ncbi:MAG: hypothetical protein QN139_09460 [Armatimonadota bacterium]|nr:hypothetical protein [Armatimonadota bacterium]MDR7593509.1 hypothetical protein [Armatimonadota bacterium]